MRTRVNSKGKIIILSLIMIVAVLGTSFPITIFAQSVSANGVNVLTDENYAVSMNLIPSDIEEKLLIETVSENHMCEEETLMRAQARTATNPANPVHECAYETGKLDTTHWSYVYFGSYPQTEVTDAATITAIDNAIYYTKEVAEQGVDVWVDGVKYRRISKQDTSYEGYFGSKAYRYFKWARIKWRVLKNDGEKLILLADNGLDCRRFHEKCEEITWESSDLREWLNKDFYQGAFSQQEQAAILNASVETYSDPFFEQGNQITQDKIYLLSRTEALNQTYGMCELGISYYDIDSQAATWQQASNYSHVRGVSEITTNETFGKANCWWWLRNANGSKAYVCDYRGVVLGSDIATNNCYAVVPMLQVKLSSNTWLQTNDYTSGDGGSIGNTYRNAVSTAMPQANIATGTEIAKDTQISLSCATPGAEIYYTTDGSIPTINSYKYTQPITINHNMTIKAMAGVQGNKPSEVVTYTYTLKEELVKVEKISIKSPSKKLAAGKKVSFTAEVFPVKATDKSVKWKSSNTKYATVSQDGKVTLKKAGIGKKVTITAEAADGSGQKASCKIKIMKHAVKSIKLTAAKKIVKAGKSLKVKAKIKTTGKSVNKTLKWSTSNSSYATVTKSGTVKTKKAGKGKAVTITASSIDGSNKKARIKIKIE